MSIHQDPSGISGCTNFESWVVQWASWHFHPFVTNGLGHVITKLVSKFHTEQPKDQQIGWQWHYSIIKKQVTRLIIDNLSSTKKSKSGYSNQLIIWFFRVHVKFHGVVRTQPGHGRCAKCSIATRRLPRTVWRLYFVGVWRMTWRMTPRNSGLMVDDLWHFMATYLDEEVSAFLGVPASDWSFCLSLSVITLIEDRWSSFGILDGGEQSKWSAIKGFRTFYQTNIELLSHLQ